MPRKARIDAPGALHHIIFRGIERREIFRDNKDRDNFLNRLGNVLSDSGTPCYAWALIPNHVHLLLKTGNTPLSTVMQRILTGHAAYFNRRHRRHGKLFQNRYKSILCQEDAYLLELVRYIHLNPLRAKVVSDFKKLDRYLYCGHSRIVGNRESSWQDVSYVLRQFGKRKSTARLNYRDFVQKGIELGRRPELTGGGLVRSLGGWSTAKLLRRSIERIKSDERILGDGNYVDEILKKANEQLESRYLLASLGYDMDKVALRVAEVLNIDPEKVWQKGKHPETVRARSLFCYWAARELGITMKELADKLGLTPPAVSLSVRRGETLAIEFGYILTIE
jgi:putative transposase